VKGFPDNMEFLCADYLQDIALNKPFDTILCLSVTKWIHFNGGDAAICKLFGKINASLNPLGILILEAQPWSSYKKKSTLTPEIKKNYRTIQFRPQEFPKYLTELGLKHILTLNLPNTSDKDLQKVQHNDNAKKNIRTKPKNSGFTRPIWVFQKN